MVPSLKWEAKKPEFLTGSSRRPSLSLHVPFPFPWCLRLISSGQMGPEPARCWFPETRVRAGRFRGVQLSTPHQSQSRNTVGFVVTMAPYSKAHLVGRVMWLLLREGGTALQLWAVGRHPVHTAPSKRLGSQTTKCPPRTWAGVPSALPFTRFGSRTHPCWLNRKEWVTSKAPGDGLAASCLGWKEDGDVSMLPAEYPRELVKSFKWLSRRGDECERFYPHPLKYENKTTSL